MLVAAIYIELVAKQSCKCGSVVWFHVPRATLNTVTETQGNLKLLLISVKGLKLADLVK
jgi:hypothetical protein